METYWEVVEPLFEKIDLSAGFEEFRASCEGVPRASVLLFAAHMALAEVWNGGFLQLLWNSTGILVPEAIEGFDSIEMFKIAQTLASAAAPLGAIYPRGRDERWDALLVNSGKSRSEIELIFAKNDNLYCAFAEATSALPFERLERRFYGLADTENGGFQEAATNYARKTTRLV